MFAVVNRIYNPLNITHCFGRNNFEDVSTSICRSLRGMNNIEYPRLYGSYLHDRSAITHCCCSFDTSLLDKFQNSAVIYLPVDIIALLRGLSKRILCELASTVCIYIDLLNTIKVLFRTYSKEDPRIT